MRSLWSVLVVLMVAVGLHGSHGASLLPQTHRHHGEDFISIGRITPINVPNIPMNASMNFQMPIGGRVKRVAALAALGWVAKADAVVGTASKAMGVIGKAANGVVSIIDSVNDIQMKRQRLEMEQKQFEQEIQEKNRQLCDEICVTAWMPWKACSARCGGGTTSRTRLSFNEGTCEGFPCRHHLAEEAPCNEECPNAGISTGTGSCTCQRGFQGECCDSEIWCEYPGKPRSGVVTGTFPAKYGQIAEFECDDAFAIVGDEVRVCRSDETWTGTHPRCEKIRCPQPSAPINGILMNMQPSYLFGEETHFHCNQGYELSGPVSRKCTSMGDEEGFFDSFTPICLPADCGAPNYPMYGEVTGSEFTLGFKVSVTCSTGFRLIGSADRTCLPSSDWSGHDPECKVIQCEDPYIPRHGSIIRERETYSYGDMVMFECEEGFLLEGEMAAKCVADPGASLVGVGGMWSNPPPVCLAAICGEPPAVENGAKDGNLYYYPNNITYTCFAGYVNRGLTTISCEKNGVWSGTPPVCEPCVTGFYKDNTTPDEECKPCPQYTETLTEASTNAHQCNCIKGYTGPAGGPCEEIECPLEPAPEHGFMTSACSNKYGDTCQYGCDAGYVMERGSSSRTCDENSHWTGDSPNCAACPQDTFQSDLRSCLPCPRSSNTAGSAANVATGCSCDAGYEGPAGGPCADIDECLDNGGRGPCSDVCENLDGTYRCHCSVPGYVINPPDMHTCVVDQTCRNLTQDDAPPNGGLVCHWYFEQNSQQCAVRCNRGYEFPSRTNNYETCGVNTGYKWTHEERGEPIDPCVTEIFPGVRLEADSKYFVRACSDLSATEQEEVKEEFARMLTEEGICMQSEEQMCKVENIGIICGRVLRRRRSRRGLVEVMESIEFSFEVQAIGEVNATVDCDQLCAKYNIGPDRCDEWCRTYSRRYMMAAVQYSETQLNDLFKRPEAVAFMAVQRDFEPDHVEPIRLSDVLVECPRGMRTDGDICVPCTPGSYLNEHTKKCKPCNRGTYQPAENQLECLPCPDGFYQLDGGSSTCDECPDKRWGFNCMKTCPCVNGRCHPETGECMCSTGWTGTNCTEDKNSCLDNDCPEGETCYDIAAPGLGYRCNSCPDGYKQTANQCVSSAQAA